MQNNLAGMDLFERFLRVLRSSTLMDDLRDGLIGEDVLIPGPRGMKPMIYADYVASGRALQQIENVIAREVLPYYANSHTEASFCGQMMTRLRLRARAEIKSIMRADEEHAVIFTGSGATAGLNRLISLLGVQAEIHAGKRPLVLLGPYEHHSNILPWRESGAEIVTIPEAADGGPDLALLKHELLQAKGRLIIGAFSAASNVTGIVSDVQAITQLLKSHGAKVVWDYAGGAPYLAIDMRLGMDAVVLSPHKFIGGPGASGLLILRKDAAVSPIPSLPGGGTVRFVSPSAHDYSDDVEAREEAGTPNVIGDIRAALCMMVKDAIGQEEMDQRLQQLRTRALAVWQRTPGLSILGNPAAKHVLPIFSFRIQDRSKKEIHQQLVTRVLSDYFGIQARGGCACAGPYAHQLLGIGVEQSEVLRQAILSGEEIAKPGWTRLGFSVLMDDAKADCIIQAVDQLARNPHHYCCGYDVDERTARFRKDAA